MPDHPIRVALDEAAFRQLVAGKVVTLANPHSGKVVQLILSDIGWDRMLAAINDAMADGDG